MATPGSRAGSRIHWWAELNLPWTAVILAAVGATILVAVGDYLTGPYLVFATFYMVPVVFTAWFAGRGPALGVAALAALTGLVSTALDPESVTAGVYVWNAVFRFVTYAFVAVLVSAERSAMRKITELASVDPLTGLLNRRRFYERASVELARSRRDSKPVAIAYIDIDELKERNDTFGHEAGDAMLVEFADVARATFRSTDLLARLGGDEFCFILPGADLPAAQHTVGRFRRQLVDGAAMLPIRFSAGIRAGEVPEGIDVESVVRSVDLLMLEAKAAGKGTSAVGDGLIDA